MDKPHSILSSKAALKAAVNTFASNDINNSRYQLNTKIADHIQWSVKERCDFSSAYSEALKQTMESFNTGTTDAPIMEMAAAKKISENYIYTITKGTKPEERVSSGLKNIEKLFEAKFKHAKLSTDRTAGNPYLFCSLVAVGVAMTAAVALTSKP